MADLPGRRAQLEKQAQQAQKAQASAAERNAPGTAPGEAAPPSPDQVDAMLDQIRHEEDIVLAGKLEVVRKKREQELQRGKPKTIEKINIEDLKFTREEKKAGLPDRIRKLPKDHPVRVLYEKGYKQKGPGIPTRPAFHEDTGLDLKQTLGSILKPLGAVLLIVGMIAGVYYGSQRYQAGKEETRNQILMVLKDKNYHPDHPKLEKEFKALYWSNWLPDLQRLLNFVEGLGINYEAFDGNPEPGSYVDYIQRHNKPFNQAEAMEWYAREMRKPSRANDP
ncbi:MAG: hypothetical protein HQL98_09925 [Magnetococcales bacterium]|nr:hypothetical protein [Magnetococcales bacterium]